ncbi:MAG: winged helix-turn-helix transcriptional regulator [Burkholderiaceae bacterium]|nr:winged helix-turn-helix transcriptional regulator [Roseateles sp.]MBV8470451.1 winged helix-turn-helix transcriptional regulator [Burkholderiaceae bacterium]
MKPSPTSAPVEAEPGQAPFVEHEALAESAQRESVVQVLRQFRQVFNAVRTHFQQVEKHAGLGGAQLWALSLVSSHPGLGVSELAATMDIHQSTASNLVRALSDRQLIKTHRNGPDKRAVQLAIEPAGSAVLARAPGPYTGVLPSALASLDDAVLERLHQDLGALLATLGTDEHAAKVPISQM